MLLAAATSIFSPHPLQAACEAIGQAGLQHVELSLDPARHEAGQAPPSDEATLARWQQTLSDQRLAVSAVDITSGDLATAGSFELCCDKLRLAQRLGAVVAIIWGGEPSDDQQRQLHYEQLRRLGDRAAELGLVLTLDTRPGLCGDSREMLRTMHAIAHPAIRLHFDTGTYLLYNRGSQGEIALQRVVSWIGSMGLKDVSGSAGVEESPPLGQGAEVDFFRTLQILQDLAFQGPCIIDRQRYGTTRNRPLKWCREWLADSVRQLRDCGWLDA